MLLESIGYMIGGSLAVVALLLFYVFKQKGYDLEAFKKHFSKEGTGDGSAAGIVAFIVVLVAMIVGAFLFSGQASAEEGWFRYTEVYMGVENTIKTSPMCEEDGQFDRTTSNGGVRQHIYGFNEWTNLVGSYKHHSCAVGIDSKSYDAFGIQFVVRIPRI